MNNILFDREWENQFRWIEYLLGRSLGPPNDGFDISSDNQCFQGCPCRLTNIAMQRRTSPKDQINERMFCSGFRHALTGLLFAVFKLANRTWRLTKGTSEKPTQWQQTMPNQA